MNNPDWLRQRISRSIGRLFSHIPMLARRWEKHFDAVISTDIPFVRPKVPLAQSRLSFITTGGVHCRTQPPFNMRDSRGDAGYRAIPATTSADQLMITHDYYDHRDAEKDLNILFPIALGRELVSRGVLGGLGTHYSFMGHIEPPHVDTLLQQTAPEVAQLLRQERIDAVLLTPA